MYAFLSGHDCMNVFPFMIVGLITGLALRKHHEVSLGFFSLASHFIHILISSLASLFYVVSWGLISGRVSWGCCLSF